MDDARRTRRGWTRRSFLQTVGAAPTLSLVLQGQARAQAADPPPSDKFSPIDLRRLFNASSHDLGSRDEFRRLGGDCAEDGLLRTPSGRQALRGLPFRLGPESLNEKRWVLLSTRPGAPARSVEVPEGEALLGAARGSVEFGWDNEFPEHRVHVPRFAIDDHPVTNAELLAFVRDGGYDEPRLWREDDWAWRTRRCVQHPHSWVREGGGFRVRSLLKDVPFDRAAEWPAMTSWAEAAAYARWRKAHLPSEAEWRRAAHGTPEGGDRRWPWGDATPAGCHGNFHFRHGSPLPSGSHPAGASAWGVLELVGNGWEWTGTPFGPFPGFEPLPRYPGYSADFFDGSHYVLLGASWATDEALLRPSFRNWFQPHYPYVFAKFRCARAV